MALGHQTLLRMSRSTWHRMNFLDLCHREEVMGRSPLCDISGDMLRVFGYLSFNRCVNLCLSLSFVKSACPSYIPTICLSVWQFFSFVQFDFHSHNCLSFIQPACLSDNLIVFPTNCLSFLKSACLSYSLLVFSTIYLCFLQFTCSFLQFIRLPYNLRVFPTISFSFL